MDMQLLTLNICCLGNKVDWYSHRSLPEVREITTHTHPLTHTSHTHTTHTTHIPHMHTHTYPHTHHTCTHTHPPTHTHTQQVSNCYCVIIKPWMSKSSTWCLLNYSKKKNLTHMALHKSHDNFQKWGVVTVNHMNDDVAEVNDLYSQLLLDSFLYEKEPVYEANCSPLLGWTHRWHMTWKTQSSCPSFHPPAEICDFFFNPN